MRSLKFTASRISELLAGGEGKTRLNYIFDVAAESVGAKDDFETKAMQHGTLNQLNAFELVFKPKYGGEWFDEFIEINDKCGASPDAIDTSFVADMKCQYMIDTFLDAIDKTPKKYVYQVQMQMMALSVEVGYICNYLTRPELYGEDWTEYPMPLELRSHIVEIKRDEEIQTNILESVEKNYPILLECAEMLGNADVLSEEDFIYRQFNRELKLRPLKENWQSKGDVYRFGNKFYRHVK